MIQNKWFSHQKNWSHQIDITLLILLMTVVTMLWLCGCSGVVSEEPSEVMQLGTAEQEYVAVFASNSSQTVKSSYGVCQTRKREKCQPDVACPGGAACLIPRSTSFTFCLSGADSYRWKSEMRDFLLGTDGFSGLPQLRNPAWASPAATWTATEVACSEAQFEFNNGVVPCFEAECGATSTHLETIPNFVLIGDASSTALTEKCWTPSGLISCNYPGTYKRRTNASSKTMIWIDVPDIAAVAEREDPAWDFGLGALHFMLEHTTRWAALVATMGIGSSYPLAAYPTPLLPGTGGYDVMQPVLHNGGHSSLGADMDDWLSTWEDCQWRNFAVGTNTEFWQAPTGCLIP